MRANRYVTEHQVKWCFLCRSEISNAILYHVMVIERWWVWIFSIAKILSMTTLAAIWTFRIPDSHSLRACPSLHRIPAMLLSALPARPTCAHLLWAVFLHRWSLTCLREAMQHRRYQTFPWLPDCKCTIVLLWRVPWGEGTGRTFRLHREPLPVSIHARTICYTCIDRLLQFVFLYLSLL